jgi:hypothetical protein
MVVMNLVITDDNQVIDFSNLSNIISNKISINTKKTAVENWVRTETGTQWYADAVVEGISAIMVWVVALSLLVVGFLLLIRTIMLVILLIASPLAYLALAFPGAQGMAKKWWDMFLKYVLYGPIVLLLMLLALVYVPSFSSSGTLGSSQFAQALGALVEVFAFGVAFVAAAMGGRWAGILGASAALNIAGRTGRRVRGAATGTSMFAGRAATAPVRGAAKGAAETTKGYVSQKGENLLVRAGLKRPGESFEAKGKRLAGKPVTGKPRTEARGATAAATDAGVMIQNNPNIFDENFGPQNDSERRVARDLSAAQLSKKHVGEALGKERSHEMADMAQHMDADRVKAMVKNGGLIGEMKEEDVQQLQVNIRVNQQLSNEEKQAAISDLMSTLNKVKNKEESDKS